MDFISNRTEVDIIKTTEPEWLISAREVSDNAIRWTWCKILLRSPQSRRWVIYDPSRREEKIKNIFIRVILCPDQNAEFIYTRLNVCTPYMRLRNNIYIYTWYIYYYIYIWYYFGSRRRTGREGASSIAQWNKHERVYESYYIVYVHKSGEGIASSRIVLNIITRGRWEK